MTFDELKALDHAHTLQTYGRFDVRLNIKRIKPN